MNVLERARRISSAAVVVLMSTAAVGACGLIPKKVTEEDCGKWVDHAFDVGKDEFTAAMKDCPSDMKKKMNEAMNDGLDDEKKGAVKRCKKKVDEKYESKDADCWMKASTLKDIKGCKWAMAEEFMKDKDSKKKKKGDDDDDDGPEEAIEQVKKMCKEAAKNSKGGDDDDSDKKKDKKKKSSDDDDDSK